MYKSTFWALHLPKEGVIALEGFVKLWDVRQAEQPVAVFRPAIGTVDCFTVTLGQTSYNDKIVAAGFDNGDIKIFDLRNMAVVKEVNITGGVCSMQFSEKSDSLLVTGINSRICYFPLDIANKESVIWESSWRKSTVWTGKLMPQSAAIFSTTAGDGSVGIWRV
ncbi:dynein axonemal assembly factor 10-like [Artemia franciscana]